MRATTNWARDDRGAVLLLGVFLSVFAVAMLYYLVGLGDAIWTRESLQDAADAGAFSAAILHARGMNLLAFINIVMAALVAVLVACRVVQGLCLLGIGIATALASSTFGASLAAVPPLQSTMVAFQNAHEGLKPAVLGTVGVLHQAQRMISVAVPPVAVVDSVLEATRHHPPARFGFAVPGGVTLPVEADRFEVLCERAGETAAALALSPLRLLGLGVAAKPIEKAVGSMTGSASVFFCGAGGSKPPVYERREEVFYPRSDAARSCEEEAVSGKDSASSCARAERELAAAEPDRRTGNCRPEQNCSLSGGYVALARAARAQCEPREGFFPTRLRWQERTVRVEYTYRRHRGWVETDVRHSEPRLHDGSFAMPCGPAGTFSTEWNREPYPSGRVSEVTPLCAEEHAPPGDEGIDGDRRTIEYKEATHLFGCVVHEVRRREPFAGGEPLSGQSGREPHRVLQDADLGSETYQLRAVSWGDESGTAQAETIVALAAWGEQKTERGGSALDHAVLGVASPLGRVSLAQAEFYYDHDGGEARSEWLWNMKWTARLVRFRKPEAGESRSSREKSPEANAGPSVRTLPDASSFGAVCEFAGAAGCAELDDSVAAWERFILH
jgi:hypothetical protein